MFFTPVLDFQDWNLLSYYYLILLMVMNVDASPQISVYLHEQAGLAIFLLVTLQETIKHMNKHTAFSAYSRMEWLRLTSHWRRY